jgi:hypothetical protein
MQVFVIRRRGIAASATELELAMTRLRSIEELPGPMLKAQWIRSYALREADGRFGMVCVFRARDVQALRRHAELVALPAEEILPVAATMLVRADAPTMLYLIRRRNFWNSAADLEKSATLSRRLGDEEMAEQVSWIRTYAVQESDGTLGTVCIYQSVSAQALREHAARVGMPADEITEVIGHVAYRDDPITTVAGAVPA